MRHIFKFILDFLGAIFIKLLIIAVVFAALVVAILIYSRGTGFSIFNIVEGLCANLQIFKWLVRV